MRASPEKKEEKERIRLALMRATLRLAAAHGFASLGLREVSREASIAPTSFYRHFSDMAELGAALIQELVAPMLARVADEVKGASVERGDAVPTLVHEVLSAAAQDPELARFMLAERRGAFPIFREALREKVACLAEALRAGLPSGVPSYAADLAVMALMDTCDRYLDSDDEARRILREQLLQIIQWLLTRKTDEERHHERAE